MKNMIKLCVTTAILLAICSCGTRCIDEKYAASLVKTKLSLSGTVTAQILKGGLSGAKLFTVTDGSKKYVIRFMTHKTPKKCLNEMHSFKIASENGYGPHVYFMNEKVAVIVMEYLSPQPITDQQRQSKELYRMLGRLLKKIHSSQSLKRTINAFDRSRTKLDQAKAQHGTIMPLATIEKKLDVIQQTVMPYVVSTPCHLNLNPNNLIFLGNDFKAIDYETAAQSDPYFDIAAVSLFHCLDPSHEEVLLTTYLERKPTLKEKKRLYLMKQVALINYASTLFKKVSPKIPSYRTLEVPSYEAFVKKWWQKKVDWDKPETLLKFAKAMVNQVIENFESQEFSDAVDILRKP